MARCTSKSLSFQGEDIQVFPRIADTQKNANVLSEGALILILQRFLSSEKYVFSGISSLVLSLQKV
jgi:hypothetical protein